MGLSAGKQQRVESAGGEELHPCPAFAGPVHWSDRRWLVALEGPERFHEEAELAQHRPGTERPFFPFDRRAEHDALGTAGGHHRAGRDAGVPAPHRAEQIDALPQRQPGEASRAVAERVDGLVQLPAARGWRSRRQLGRERPRTLGRRGDGGNPRVAGWTGMRGRAGGGYGLGRSRFVPCETLARSPPCSPASVPPRFLASTRILSM